MILFYFFMNFGKLEIVLFFFIFILGGQISIATGGEKKGIETEFVA